MTPSFLQRRWQQWLNRRIPASHSIRLSHRSIFIVPSRAGLVFLVLLLVMLVTAINYQNSLVYALTFWLFSLGLVTMLMTFRNLAGVSVSAERVQPCFVGDSVELPLRLLAGKSSHESLQLALPKQAGLVLRLAAQQQQRVKLTHTPAQRGRLQVERILIESCFPLGLFRAWSWVQLEFQGCVYPQPQWIDFIGTAATGAEVLEQAASNLQQGQQDFFGLRPYQAGDSLRRIAWKQLARGKGLVSKEFDQEQSAQALFDFADLAPRPIEQRLSHLCAWLLHAHEQGWQFGLKLPREIYAVDHGEAHLARCLTALAEFPQEAQ